MNVPRIFRVLAGIGSAAVRLWRAAASFLGDAGTKRQETGKNRRLMQRLHKNPGKFGEIVIIQKKWIMV